MINGLLAYSWPGMYEWMVILFIFLICFGIPVALIILLIVQLVKSSRERKEIKRQLGELREELKQIANKNS